MCEIKIKKTGKGIEGIKNLNSREKNILRRDAVTGKSPIPADGFLHKLTVQDKHRELKIKFIENCGKQRGYLANKEINSAEDLGILGKVIKEKNKIESTKEFDLVKLNNYYSGEGQLGFKSSRDFETWFE